ncbi:MAG: hypothetical protein ACOC7T_02470 [Planctomycetota bacterium]
MRTSAVVGLVLLTAIVFAMFSQAQLLSAPAATLTVLLSAGLWLLGVGFRAAARALGAVVFQFANRRPPWIDERTVAALERMIAHTYGAGAIGAAIGTLQLFAQASGGGDIASGVGTAMLPLFYSLLLAEILLRPTATRWRLEFASPETKPDEREP